MSKRKIQLYFTGVFIVLLCAAMMISGRQVDAERPYTDWPCQYRVQPFSRTNLYDANSVRRLPSPDGRRYVTVEYSVIGNDNARRKFLNNVFGTSRFFTEDGWAQNSSVNCTPADTTSGQLWNGSQIDIKNSYYRALFEGGQAYEVYLGVPNGASYVDMQGYASNPGIGIEDAPHGWRDTLGISNTPSRVFATVNDGGRLLLNGSEAWCLGMNNGTFLSSPCRGVDASRVYPTIDGSGDFAGYLNAENSNARLNIATSFRSRVQNSQPINNLIGYNPDSPSGNVPLVLHGMNTRDSIPPADFVRCLNTIPGTGGCPGSDPFLNSKSSAVLTFVIDPKPGFDLTPARTINSETGVVNFTVTNSGDGASRLSDNQGSMITRRVWVNGSSVPAYAADNRVVIETGSNNTWTESHTLSGLSEGDVICAAISVKPFSGTTGESSWLGLDHPSYQHGGSQERHVGGLNVDCETVVAKPYFKVYGGDVQVGKGAGGVVCETDSTAGIVGWTRQVGTQYTGAGGQLAAFALGQIEEYATGQALASNNPKRLTFANSDGIVPGRPFGGGLDANAMSCSEDYWRGADTVIDTPGPNLNATETGIYKVNGPYLLNTQGDNDLTGGQRITIYVDGDVYINSNITYQSTSYSSIDDIPSFRLIARGNIGIDPNVDTLNGLFVALPKADGSGGGTFYSCAKYLSTPTHVAPPINEWLTTGGGCYWTPLTVYGAVIANAIKLNRTGGTLSDSTTGELTDYIGSSGGRPAEKFIFTPELWLTGAFRPGGGVDSIRTLPPVL